MATATTSRTSGAPLTGGQHLAASRARSCRLARPQRTVSRRPAVVIARSSSSSRGSEGSESPVARLGDRTYVNFTGFPFPLGPLLDRRTCCYEVEKGRVWTFEQEQSLGFTNVTTNTRMTVIKLSTGGLWVHAPIAPTRECIRLLQELDAPVEHVVLPTFAYEHKIFMAPFCRRFPEAQQWVAPRQWSWPVNLPVTFFGILKPKTLGESEAPWMEDIDMKILNPPSLGLAEYVGFPEVAFFHRQSRSLLLTDSVIYVPADPPEVIRSQNLLDAATDNLIVQLSMTLVSDVDISGYDLQKTVDDTPASRRKGWRRMTLQVLFFGPEDIYNPDASFRAISNRVVVSPIVRKLVYNKIPGDVRAWVDSIAADWNFRQIIPCHFAGPVACNPREFRKAYEWLEAESGEFASGAQEEPEAAAPARKGGLPSWWPFTEPRGIASKRSAYFTFPEADMKLLNGLNKILLDVGVFKTKRQ